MWFEYKSKSDLITDTFRDHSTSQQQTNRPIVKALTRHPFTDETLLYVTLRGAAIMVLLIAIITLLTYISTD